jgi:hypothetical protein
LVVTLAQDCNNPLFSVDNWPEDEIDRPAYLSQPVDIATVDLGLCSQLIGSCSKTCCDANTIQDIDALVLKYLDHLAKKGEHFIGPILDTIGDFDPNTQEQIGSEYDIDGNLVGDYVGELHTSNSTDTQTHYSNSTDTQTDYSNGTDTLPDTNSTDTLPDTNSTEPLSDTNSTDTQSETPVYKTKEPNSGSNSDKGPKDKGEDDKGPEDKGEDDKGPKDKGEDGKGHKDKDTGKGPKLDTHLPKEERDKNIKEQQDQMGKDKYRPKHRGKRRYRPGLLDLTEEQKAEISALVSDMVIYLGAYSGNMAKCLDSQAKQMAGMFCMGCDACYGDYVVGDSSILSVELNQDSCTEMADNCSNYMEAVKDLKNKFKDFKFQIRAILNPAIQSGTINKEDVNDDDLDEIVREDAEEVCSEDTCTEYLCKEVFEENGGLIPSDEITDPNHEGIISPMNDTRRMETSYVVSLEYGNSGFNPQNVDAVYSTQVDNYNSADAGSVLEDDTDSGKLLILSALAFLALL